MIKEHAWRAGVYNYEKDRKAITFELAGKDIFVLHT